MQIKQEMISGVVWSAIEKYSGLILSIIISGILARLISPRDFGVIAIATVLINFFDIFAGLGIGPAIIQRKELTEKDLDSIFTFTILIGCFLSLAFFCSSAFISSIYGNNLLIPVCRILSINLLFASLNMVPLAEMQRDKKFKLIASRTALLQIISGGLAVFAAYNGYGIYSLLIAPVITSIGMFLFNFKFYPKKIDFSFDIKPLKLIYSFSSYQFLFTFMNYFSRNLDKLIVGRYFSLKELGFYDKSYRLMMLPLQNVTHVITPVMQPILSSLQNEKLILANKYNMIIKFIGAISFPLSIFLYFSAKELIQIVYGDSWNAAVPVFKILALSLSIQMILSTSGAIYQAVNATKYMFFNGLINSIITISGLILSIYFFSTIESIAWAWNITISINMIISYLIMYRIVLNSSLIKMLNVLVVPFFASLVIGAFLFVFDNFFLLDKFLSISLKFIITLVVYCTILQSMKFYDFLSLLKKNRV